MVNDKQTDRPTDRLTDIALIGAAIAAKNYFPKHDVTKSISHTLVTR